MKIICIGDSITFGYGILKKDCWVSLIKSKLRLDVTNKGINGDTTAGMLSRSFKDVITLSPSHVMIMGGCNDFMCNRNLNMVENNLEELVKEALSYHIVPIIGIEPPVNSLIAVKKWSSSIDYHFVNKLEKEYHDWIINFCIKLNINYIDFYQCFKENLKNKNPRELYIDGIHPTPLGHNLMFNCIIDVFHSMKLL